jgi:hypothetical protein
MLGAIRLSVVILGVVAPFKIYSREGFLDAVGGNDAGKAGQGAVIQLPAEVKNVWA